MNRRTLLRYAAAFGIAKVAPANALQSAATSSDRTTRKPIVLYCDLEIHPDREQEMLDNFHHHFKPAAEKFDGYIDLKMLKIRKVIQGAPPPPPGVDYRFQLTFESEEKRQVWIHSDVHKKNWPLVENTVSNKDYLTLLTDSV